MTITVDTNVLLDVVQKREPHYAASARVVSLVTSGQLTGVFPSHALTTLYYLARKHASKPEAEAAMDRVLAAFRIGNLDHAAWEEANGISHNESTGDPIGRWCYRTEHGVADRVVIETSGKLAYNARGLEALQSRRDRIAGAKTLKMRRSEYPPLPMAINQRKHLFISSL